MPDSARHFYDSVLGAYASNASGATTRNAPSIADLKSLIPPAPPISAIYIHPDNVDRILEHVVAAGDNCIVPFIVGVKVYTNKYLPEFTKRWVPPRGPFWEMEPSDEAWAAKLGFGHYEDTDEPYILAVRERDWLKVPFMPVVALLSC